MESKGVKDFHPFAKRDLFSLYPKELAQNQLDILNLLKISDPEKNDQILAMAS